MTALPPPATEAPRPERAPPAWWSLPEPALLAALGSAPAGLSAAEAAARLARHGPNLVDERPLAGWGQLALRQVSSPLVLILIVGAVLSAVIGEGVEALTILAILACGAVLGFVQEARASAAVRALRSRLALSSRVRRDDRVAPVAAAQVVPGDIVELAAGHLVPADGRVLAARDFLVVEAALTGESFPVEKQPGVAAAGATPVQRRNCVFAGTSVRSGTATVLIAATGRDTALGAIGARLGSGEAETEFARGVRRFGELLLRVMLLVVVAVLLVNQALGRPMIESLLFAVALSVGLSPELLPAIVGVLLARSTRRLAREGVLVRRFEAVEDLGGIDVLCADKTGTLTQGVLAVEGSFAPDGTPSAAVLALAVLNARFETGIENPLDQALVAAGRAAGVDDAGWRKVDEIPYDFRRRRLAIVLAPAGARPEAPHRLIVKGAVAQTLAICDRLRAGEAAVPLDDAARARLEAWVRDAGGRGLRVLALATRELPPRERHAVADEAQAVLEGFVAFSDPPKPDAAQAIRALATHGVRVKVVTGDNRHVAAHLAAQVGLDPQAMLTGEQLAAMRDESLWHLAPRTDLFVEVEPAQKERIVRALQHRGHAVGYLGDGINDAPALQAADVGLSVDGAVDVARESADVVLLRPDLGLLLHGIAEGRRTFANTLKYIQITTSANFGNMVSMAIATPLLPFLPMTAAQILLNNFLSDLPALTLATDRVEPAALRRPQRWDVARVRRFMLVFGLISSAFDLLGFVLLRAVFAAEAARFHTAWFLASLLTELGVLLVLRTPRPAWRSRPAGLLAGVAAAVALAGLAWTQWPPLAATLGFEPLPPGLLAAMLALVLAYLAATEAAKRLLHRGAA